MPHPDEGLIHAWLDGELDATEAARIEALVANDAEWGAAAAEARGLIAASARIVGALDRVPANVIPKVPAARPASRRWVWRAAAVLALMAGSAVVLERESPVLPAPKTDVGTQPVTPVAPAPTPAPAQQQRPEKPRQEPPLAEGAKIVAAKKNPEPKSELADTKQAEPAVVQRADPAVALPARDKDAVNPLSGLQGKVTGANVVSASGSAAGAERRAANAPMAAVAQSMFTRLQPSCFEQREPPDSASRIIRLNAAALADSIRLETLVLRGDTLAAVNGRFTAIRVPCPAP